jgi:hypothetical protein
MLTDKDWLTIHEVARLLVPFSVLTKVMSTSRCPILPGVIPYWNSLYDALDDFEPSATLPDAFKKVLRNSARYRF